MHYIGCVVKVNGDDFSVSFFLEDLSDTSNSSFIYPEKEGFVPVSK